jgi:hypothetical protein
MDATATETAATSSSSPSFLMEMEQSLRTKYPLLLQKNEHIDFCSGSSCSDTTGGVQYHFTTHRILLTSDPSFVPSSSSPSKAKNQLFEFPKNRRITHSSIPYASIRGISYTICTSGSSPTNHIQIQLHTAGSTHTEKKQDHHHSSGHVGSAAITSGSSNNNTKHRCPYTTVLSWSGVAVGCEFLALSYLYRQMRMTQSSSTITSTTTTVVPTSGPKPTVQDLMVWLQQIRTTKDEIPSLYSELGTRNPVLSSLLCHPNDETIVTIFRCHCPLHRSNVANPFVAATTTTNQKRTNHTGGDVEYNSVMVCTNQRILVLTLHNNHPAGTTASITTSAKEVLRNVQQRVVPAFQTTSRTNTTTLELYGCMDVQIIPWSCIGAWTVQEEIEVPMSSGMTMAHYQLHTTSLLDVPMLQFQCPHGGGNQTEAVHWQTIQSVLLEHVVVGVLATATNEDGITHPTITTPTTIRDNTIHPDLPTWLTDENHFRGSHRTQKQQHGVQIADVNVYYHTIVPVLHPTETIDIFLHGKYGDVYIPFSFLLC